MGLTHARQRWGTNRRERASRQPLLAECLGKDHRCVYHWLPHSCCEETRLNLTTGSGACWQLVCRKEEAGEVREGCVSQGPEVVAGPMRGIQGSPLTQLAEYTPWKHPALTGLQSGSKPQAEPGAGLWMWAAGLRRWGRRWLCWPSPHRLTQCCGLQAPIRMTR